MSAVVAVVNSRAEAELIVGMLRSHGLRAYVSADDAGGAHLELQSQGVRVMSAPDDAAAARLLLHTVNPPDPAPELNRFQRWVMRLLGADAGDRRQ
jgi:hypothetical protein